jgi:hypothetical protein
MVSGIRTVMVTTPTMLRDLIERLAQGRVQLDIIAEFDARHDLARRLTSMRPDLVVIGLGRNETDGIIRGLLRMLPATKFIAFSGNGRGAFGFELQVYQTDLGDASPGVLIDFVRGSALGSGG